MRLHHASKICAVARQVINAHDTATVAVLLSCFLPLPCSLSAHGHACAVPESTYHVPSLGQTLCCILQVISDAHGNAKGKVGNPLADPPLRPDGKLNVGGAVGKGVLAVVRSNAQAERPFTGRAAAALGTCYQAYTVGRGMKAVALHCVKGLQPT